LNNHMKLYQGDLNDAIEEQIALTNF